MYVNCIGVMYQSYTSHRCILLKSLCLWVINPFMGRRKQNGMWGESVCEELVPGRLPTGMTFSFQAVKTSRRF